MPKDFFRVSPGKAFNLIELLLPDTIDTQEFDKINETLLGSIRGKTTGQWIMDLTGVQYLGSAMLGLIINIRQQIKSGGGKLVLCGLSAELRDIFYTCSLERLFTVVPTRPEAIKQVGG